MKTRLILRSGQPGTKTLAKKYGDAKAAGGRWNPEQRLWFVKYGKIAGTVLENYIYVDES